MKYDNDECNRFVADCQKAGLQPEHYRGRNFWQGPAVRADDISDVMAETRVKCQMDQMGLGVIVYPKASGRLID